MKILQLALLFGILAGCSKHKPLPPPPPTAVKTAVVIQGPTQLYIESYGHANPPLSVEIKSQNEGVLVKVLFKDGQDVKQGDLLCVIDPRPFDAALKAAEATMAQNIANLKYAQDKVRRYTPLVQDEYVSMDNYEEYATSALVYEALVKQNKAQMEEAKLNLEYCYLYAPMDARAGKIQIDQGNLIEVNNTLLVTLNQITPMRLDFTIPEYEFPRIQSCIKLGTIKVIGFAGKEESFSYEGTLDFIDNAVDVKTGTVALRGIFPNLDRSIWPGQFLKARIMLEKLEEAIIIPTQAIQISQSGKFVYVVKPDMSVEERKIVTRAQVNETTIVESGLKKGECIVTEGQFNLYPGAKIQQ